MKTLKKNQRKPQLLSTLLSLFALMFLMATQAFAAQPVELHGFVAAKTADCLNPKNHNHAPDYYLFDDTTREEIHLQGFDNQLQSLHLNPRQKVRIKGVRKDNAADIAMRRKQGRPTSSGLIGSGADIEIQQIELVPVTEAEPPVAEGGNTLTMLSCLLVFISTNTDGCMTSETSARNLIFDNSANANLGMQTVTKGRFGLQLGNGTGVPDDHTINLQLNVNSGDYNSKSIETLALNKLFNDKPAQGGLGLNRNNWSRILLFAPGGITDSSFSAYAYYPNYSYSTTGMVSMYGGSSWSGHMNTYIHELGHNFGFKHSGKGSDEYGDRACVMGGGKDGSRHRVFNAVKLLQKDWMDVFPNAKKSISTDATIDLYPISSDPNVVTQPIMVNFPNTGYYASYVRNQEPYGYVPNSGDRDKVFVHLCANPSSDISDQVANIAVGGSYTGPGVVIFERYGPNNEYATVSFDMNDGNTKPVANAQSVNIVSNTPTAITLSGSDANGNALTYSLVTNPTNGTLSGTAPNLTYTSNTNYSGSDSFVFKVHDGKISSFATVSINVTLPNIAPVANNQSVSAFFETPQPITLTATDANNNPLSYSMVSSPSKGSLSGTPPNLTYTPNNGVSGSDSFTFRAYDGSLYSNTATVSISISSTPNSTPVVSAGANQTVSITSGVGLGWFHAAWTGDADSGISSANTYTAKHCFGDNNAGSVTVNGVSFVESFATSGTGWSLSGAVINWTGNDDASVSGNSEKLAQEFIYDGNPRTVTLSGLTPGESYEANFYSAGWDVVDRSQTFSATGTGITNAVINQNQYGNNNGIRIRCVYTATATTQQFVITPTGTSIGTFHLYALSNHQVITSGATATLNGSATDADGHPLTTTWSVFSKDPSTAANPTFANSSQPVTTATFTEVGTYTLRLSANDGYITKTSDVTITVGDSTPTYALTVTSGSGDGAYASGAQVTITADAPASGYRFVNWTSSGGGSFANANSSTTTFTMPGNAVTVTANYALNTAPVVNAGANQTVSLQSVAGPAQMILAATDPIQGIKNTAVGGNSTAGVPGTDWPTTESPPMAIDGSVDTKYLNKGTVGSGFYITPGVGATTLTGVRIYTANDASGRDPLTISIEGANGGDLSQGSSWTLIQDNINLGIDALTTRKAAGPLVAVTASASYKSYRIIVKSQRGTDAAVQYSEMQLFGTTGGTGATVNLNGSATDADGDSLTTTWSVVSKDPSTAANPTFANASQASTTATFTEEGAYLLRLSANDGYVTKTSDVTITVGPPLPAKYATWAGGTFAKPFTDTALTSNPDGDSMSNLMEFAFGTDPTLSTEGPLVIDGSKNGSPTLIKNGGNFDYYFVRRKDHGTSGSVSYTAQFSSNLTSFTNSADTPIWVANCASDPTRYEVVKVPFPNGTRFGRVEIVEVP